MHPKITAVTISTDAADSPNTWTQSVAFNRGTHSQRLFINVTSASTSRIARIAGKSIGLAAIVLEFNGKGHRKP